MNGLREIEQMVEQGRPFGEIEDRIEEMDLPEDAKAALWLYGWSSQSEPKRSRVVVESLTLALRPLG